MQLNTDYLYNKQNKVKNKVKRKQIKKAKSINVWVSGKANLATWID